MENRTGETSRSETSSFVREIGLSSVKQAASNDNGPADALLDQYYTRLDVAERLYKTFLKHVDASCHILVEPSAGDGAFFRLLPAGSLGYDLEPRFPGIKTEDFLKIRVRVGRDIAVIGNPPFGVNANMAVAFFNHAARQARAIGFIVPRTFRKASIENRLNQSFHLIYEEVVPDDAFRFRDGVYHVPALFQIWVLRRTLRPLRFIETRHPDFEFTTAECADFAINRVGAGAGRLHHNFDKSPSSTYFIRGDVEGTIAKLDFTKVVGNVAGNPSLAKSEIIALYRAYTERGPT